MVHWWPNPVPGSTLKRDAAFQKSSPDSGKWHHCSCTSWQRVKVGRKTYTQKQKQNLKINTNYNYNSHSVISYSSYLLKSSMECTSEKLIFIIFILKWKIDICSHLRSALLKEKSAYYTWWPKIKILRNSKNDLKSPSLPLFDASQPYQSITFIQIIMRERKVARGCKTE